MSWDHDDEIGYGKPPRYTRFKKGKSGNPKGRPRIKKAAEVPPDTQLDDSLRKLYDHQMKIKVAGKEKKVSLYEAIAMKQQTAALGGSVTAQRDVLRSKAALDERDARRKAAAAHAAMKEAQRKANSALEFYDYLVSLHAKQMQVYEQAQAAGRDPEPCYPHPEDFVFDHAAKKATIIGPWDKDAEHHYRKLTKTRDFHLVDHVILLRQRPQGAKLHRTLSAFNMCWMDLLLPKRQRLQGDDLNVMFDLLFKMPIKELRDWRSDLKVWLAFNPLPEPSKEGMREVYKTVDAIMKPVLKPFGYKSLAKFEHDYEAGLIADRS